MHLVGAIIFHYHVAFKRRRRHMCFVSVLLFHTGPADVRETARISHQIGLLMETGAFLTIFFFFVLIGVNLQYYSIDLNSMRAMLK